MHLLIGLGNPGRRYEKTRHNVGFLVSDRLAQRAGARCERKRFGALTAEVRLGSHSAVVAKPQSFMNLSGQPAASLVGFYKAPVDRVVVVHDDLDLPFGQVRVKVGGGHGGHNGLRDLQARIGAGFVRVRFGISRPPPEWDTADYVLGRWSPEEQAALDERVDLAADAVQAILDDGPKAAMNFYNARARQEQREARAPSVPRAD